jgi:hypothetical protein
MDTATLTRPFATPPEPLSRLERISVAVAAVLVALSRWPALAKSLWDWDEALFALALQEYDVAAYHPHPPGFPLFVAAAKLIPAGGFHALQILVFIFACGVIPAAFFFARESRAPAFVALTAALLLAFFPNVWFYGGTALSDVPSMVLSLVAAALLLRGCRSNASLIAGFVVLGIAAGVRPQNLIIGLAPAVIAFLCRRRAAILGAGIALVIVIASYAGAAAASGGWSAYAEALGNHQKYIRETDSFLAAGRPSLLRVADDFFFRPFRALPINIAIAVLALAALIRRRAWTLVALATFGPFCLFAWLFLDFHSASRFSIAYMPLFAILAADGIDATRRARPIALGVMLALLFAWTWPLLPIVHRTDSPPVAAAEYIRATIDPKLALVYADERLGPHAALLLDGYTRRTSKGEIPIVPHERATVVLLREGTAQNGTTFSRVRERLDRIARDRYFDVSVVPAQRIVFEQGWFGEQGPRQEPFRWMMKTSKLRLPPVEKNARLYLRMTTPVAASITLRFGGREVARFNATRGTFERTWDLGGVREVSIETTGEYRDPKDPRPLALRLDAIEVR